MVQNIGAPTSKCLRLVIQYHFFLTYEVHLSFSVVLLLKAKTFQTDKNLWEND